jgi:alkylation response protein AidB-like acyl-CoA dehydrogenase
MNLQFSEDQRALLDAVTRIVERHAATPAIPERLQYSEALATELLDAGFFDCITVEELGPVAATAMVMELSKLPLCAELVASSLVTPWLCPQRPGPTAVLWGSETAPVRFLPIAQTVIRVRGTAVEFASLQAGDVLAVESLFAYPMGVLRAPSSLHWEAIPDASAPRLRTQWQIGIAAETAGCLAAALQSVLDHVKARRQFGRPLGAFQAVQHRLAECATQIEGAKWLALHAAGTGGAQDAATAAGYAQDIARKVAYDLHQFMGAMGLTLEHPLHRWTYRTKLLRSELGGCERNYAAAARAAWNRQGSTLEGAPQ